MEASFYQPGPHEFEAMIEAHARIADDLPTAFKLLEIAKISHVPLSSKMYYPLVLTLLKKGNSVKAEATLQEWLSSGLRPTREMLSHVTAASFGGSPSMLDRAFAALIRRCMYEKDTSQFLLKYLQTLDTESSSFTDRLEGLELPSGKKLQLCYSIAKLLADAGDVPATVTTIEFSRGLRELSEGAMTLRALTPLLQASAKRLESGDEINPALVASWIRSAKHLKRVNKTVRALVEKHLSFPEVAEAVEEWPELAKIV